MASLFKIGAGILGGDMLLGGLDSIVGGIPVVGDIVGALKGTVDPVAGGVRDVAGSAVNGFKGVTDLFSSPVFMYALIGIGVIYVLKK